MTAERRLGRRDIALFTISAILTIDGLAAAAAMGVQSLTWCLITFLFFALPYAIICVELGTEHPSRGGIVYWVRLAFGKQWAARTSWLYWINVALWMPAVFIMTTGVIARLFWPEMPLIIQIFLALCGAWLAVGLCCVSMDIGKWIPNAGACCKMLIVALLGIGGVTTALRDGVANPMALVDFSLQWNDGLRFFPVIIFSLMGFDVICCAGDEMKNPKKDLPIALLVAGLIISVLYMFAIFGILAALPAEQIGLIHGLIDTIEKLLAPLPYSEYLVTLLGLLAIFSFIANIVTWSIGANRAAADAAQDEELPPIFARMHPVYQTPTGASLLSGIVSTIAILLYGLMANSAEDLYWSLFSFSSLIMLLPYLLLFPAYLVLKKQIQGKPAGWHLSQSDIQIYSFTLLPFLLTSLAVIFFIIPPGSFDIQYSLTILTGLIVTIGIGEWICRPNASQIDSNAYEYSTN